MTKSKSSRRNGQTMVEYIIIVVLIAISLLVLFGKLRREGLPDIPDLRHVLDGRVLSKITLIRGDDVRKNVIDRFRVTFLGPD